MTVEINEIKTTLAGDPEKNYTGYTEYMRETSLDDWSILPPSLSEEDQQKLKEEAKLTLKNIRQFLNSAQGKSEAELAQKAVQLEKIYQDLSRLPSVSHPHLFEAPSIYSDYSDEYFFYEEYSPPKISLKEKSRRLLNQVENQLNHLKTFRLQREMQEIFNNARKFFKEYVSLQTPSGDIDLKIKKFGELLEAARQCLRLTHHLPDEHLKELELKEWVQECGSDLNELLWENIEYSRIFSDDELIKNGKKEKIDKISTALKALSYLPINKAEEFFSNKAAVLERKETLKKEKLEQSKEKIQDGLTSVRNYRNCLVFQLEFMDSIEKLAGENSVELEALKKIHQNFYPENLSRIFSYENLCKNKKSILNIVKAIKESLLKEPDKEPDIKNIMTIIYDQDETKPKIIFHLLENDPVFSTIKHLILARLQAEVEYNYETIKKKCSKVEDYIEHCLEESKLDNKELQEIILSKKTAISGAKATLEISEDQQGDIEIYQKISAVQKCRESLTKNKDILEKELPIQYIGLLDKIKRLLASFSKKIEESTHTVLPENPGNPRNHGHTFFAPPLPKSAQLLKDINQITGKVVPAYRPTIE